MSDCHHSFLMYIVCLPSYVLLCCCYRHPLPALGRGADVQYLPLSPRVQTVRLFAMEFVLRSVRWRCEASREGAHLVAIQRHLLRRDTPVRQLRHGPLPLCLSCGRVVAMERLFRLVWNWVQVTLETGVRAQRARRCCLPQSAGRSRLRAHAVSAGLCGVVVVRLGQVQRVVWSRHVAKSA